MSREFIFVESLAFVWKTACTLQRTERSCSRRRVLRWRIRSGKRDRAERCLECRKSSLPQARGDLCQSLIQLLARSQEPGLIATIRLSHKISQSGTGFHVWRDVADNSDAQMVCYEFLDDLTRDARFQLKEVLAQ